MFRTRLYRDGELKAENFPMADVSDHLEDPANVVWVDVCEPDTADLAAIAEELQLHRLAVEDAVTEHQRPKLDRYDTHLFVTAYAVRLDAGLRPAGHRRGRRLRHAGRARHGPQVRGRSPSTTWWPAGTAPPTSPSAGSSFLLHGLLDFVVDSHFDAVQALDDEIEELEDMLFDDRPHDQEVQRRSLRAAQEPGAAAPRRAADARGRQHADAPRPARGRPTR